MWTLPIKTVGGIDRRTAQPVTRAHLSAPRRLNAGPPRRQVSRKQLRVSAARKQYPDPELIQETLEAFPDKGVANVEEARALIEKGGYRYVDVRPKIEYDDVGRVAGSVNIPVKNGQKKWNSEKQKKVFLRSDNPDFLKVFEKSFPDKEKKLLIGCSDGRRYAMDALMALDEAGYTNIVGLKGGYYAWSGVFDNKGNRRVYQEYVEDHFKGGDSAGIHGSGAGFSRSDFVEQYVPPEYEGDDEE